jgi:hypothetical protein
MAKQYSKNRGHATAATQAEVWRLAREQARAVGMLRALTELEWSRLQ